VSASARDWPRSVVVDSGVLAAAIDADEPHHIWANRALTSLRGSFFTCEACLTEAIHIMGNAAPAVKRLGRLVSRMTVISFSDGKWREVLAEVARMSPGMDFADGCVVDMVRARRDASALTLDHRDFVIYRVPFASPVGEFYL
jgi:predicted nucleic acid-binding protein